MQKLLTFFSKNVSLYAIFNDQSFKLTNNVISFWTIGPRKIKMSALLATKDARVQVLLPRK